MQEIEDLAYETYSKNIEYLALKHTEISKLLTVFEMALNKGDYKELYELEYLDNQFDIKLLKTDKYLYNKEADQFSKKFVNSVNYKKDDHIFEGFPIYHFTDKQFNALPEYSKHIKSMLPLMDYYATNFKPNETMKEINKFIFVGVGLGLHIPLVNDKIHANEYLIVEDSLEIFKLSLFTVKYYELAQKAELFFSIADDENIFLQTVALFLNTSFYDNRYLKYIHLPLHSNKKIKLIQNSLMSQSFIFFPYQAELNKFLKPLEFINTGSKVLNLARPIETLLNSDIPVLILAAGPSFKSNIDWIKKNQNKFIIIAVAAVLKTLYKNDITPDILTHIDGSNKSNLHFEDIDLENYLQNTLCFFGSNVTSFVRNQFNKQNVYNFEEDTNYFDNIGSITASCVGSFSLLLSLGLGTKKTYLLGLDLAVNQDTGATHYSEEHVGFKKANLADKDALHYNLNSTDNLFEIKGNFQEIVFTNSLLHTSVQLLYQTIPIKKSHKQDIYNMSSGAYIQKTIPLQVKDIEMSFYSSLEKNELSLSLKSVLDTYTFTYLSIEDIHSLKKRLKHAQKLSSTLQEYLKSPKGNATSYLYDLLGLVSQTLKGSNKESVNLVRIYYSFFQFMIPMIMDMFNTKNLKNEKRHIKKIHTLLMSEMINISNIYIQTIENFIKEKIDN